MKSRRRKAAARTSRKETVAKTRRRRAAARTPRAISRTAGKRPRTKPKPRTQAARAPRRAVILLSGGLDSSTCLLIARSEGFEAHALSFEYGQRHAVELERARAVASRYGAASHRVLRIDLPERRASALTDPDAAVPRGGVPGEGPIPPTYVPARNTLFLAHAAALGESIGAGVIFIGANVLDYSGYPDCRPEFLAAFERALRLGTKAGVEGALRFEIRAPLLAMTKAQIVRRAASLGLDFALTSSCYDPGRGGRPCGGCDSCRLRAKGFAEAGLPDPAVRRMPRRGKTLSL